MNRRVPCWSRATQSWDTQAVHLHGFDLRAVRVTDPEQRGSVRRFRGYDPVPARPHRRLRSRTPTFFESSGSCSTKSRSSTIARVLSTPTLWSTRSSRSPASPRTIGSSRSCPRRSTSSAKRTSIWRGARRSETLGRPPPGRRGRGVSAAWPPDGQKPQILQAYLDRFRRDAERFSPLPVGGQVVPIGPWCHPGGGCSVPALVVNAVSCGRARIR